MDLAQFQFHLQNYIHPRIPPTWKKKPGPKVLLGCHPTMYRNNCTHCGSTKTPPGGIWEMSFSMWAMNNGFRFGDCNRDRDMAGSTENLSAAHKAQNPSSTPSPCCLPSTASPSSLSTTLCPTLSQIHEPSSGSWHFGTTRPCQQPGHTGAKAQG